MMNPDTMRRIDYWVGIPICFFLTVIYKISRLLGLKNPKYHETPSKILFVELAEMGSTVLAYPALAKAQQRYPNAEIYFLLFDHIKESMDILNVIPKERVLTIRGESVFTLAWDTLKFMAVSRRKKIDTVINLEMFARFSTILSYVSGARRRVGFYRYHQEGLYIGNFLTHKVQYNPHIHTAHSFISLVDALFAPKGQIPLVKMPVPENNLAVPHYRPTKKAQENIWSILKKINPDISQRNRLILVNPNASKLISIRKWPLESYAQLITKLLDDKDIYVAITGVKAEKPDAEYIFKAVNNPRVLDLAGKTTLSELIDLYSIADMLITNDSGPAHFATLTDISIVVFFGPETPKLYKPLSDNCTVIYSHFMCSPCVSAYNQRLSPCNNNLCLKNISVAQVYKTVTGILSKKRRKI